MAKVRALPDGALPDFEGKPVRQCTIKITHAGDGLSEALEVAPVALHTGADVYYVLHGQVDKVGFPRFDTLGEELVREHVVRTVEIIPVTRADVDKMLREGIDRVRKLREETLGVQRLPEAPAEGAEPTDISKGRRKPRTPREGDGGEA